ncbi:MAG: hypothetical protein CMP20_15900 [Rickettsiales bacterium]|nr:hypothetical protein [Rickettsiales bacterium]
MSDNSNEILAKVFKASFQPEGGDRARINRTWAAEGLSERELSPEQRCWYNLAKNVTGQIVGVVSKERVTGFGTDKTDYIAKCRDLYVFCNKHVKPEDLSCEWNTFDELRTQLSIALEKLDSCKCQQETLDS